MVIPSICVELFERTTKHLLKKHQQNNENSDRLKLAFQNTPSIKSLKDLRIHEKHFNLIAFF